MDTQIIRNLFLFLGASLSLTSMSFAQEKVNVVSESNFHALIIDKNGVTRKYETTVIPNIPDFVCYGWQLQLTNADNLVKFTEKFSLPSEPDYWANEDNKYATNTISNDRKTSVTEKFVVPDNEWIENSWCIAEGDPNGIYTMEVFISGALAHEFKFEIVSVKEFQKLQN
ncbi:hypothetical protein [Kiloniella sp. EL199]|uniref:hypothetical protein n=1 Tax=Kiloniella sp. EL199 TaxID=2107581 RepID=UPI0013C455B3|nr:hypothetical protein [Kiloniella sp. EL199]